MTHDTTHITKEGLLLAIEEEFPNGSIPSLHKRNILARAAELSAQGPKQPFIDIVFDGPPGPESGRFVEVENADGASIRLGEWVHREDGYWVIRFVPDELSAQDASPKDGWKLVPILPTKEMIEASCKLKLARIMDGRKCTGIERGVVKEYQAMLAAAPESPK
jgi:hypothetical protein